MPNLASQEEAQKAAEDLVQELKAETGQEWVPITWQNDAHWHFRASLQAVAGKTSAGDIRVFRVGATYVGVFDVPSSFNCHGQSAREVLDQLIVKLNGVIDATQTQLKRLSQ